MEIVPGVGLPVVRLGQTLEDIAAVAGPPFLTDSRRALWEASAPPFGVYFDAEARCDLIEVYLSREAGERVTFCGVELVGRRMDDVVADLRSSGLDGRRSPMTVDYDEGFTLWSLGELVPDDRGGDAAPGTLVEGVAIAKRDRDPSTA